MKFRLDAWTVLGSVVIAIILFALSIVAIGLTSPRSATGGMTAANLTIIPRPSATTPAPPDLATPTLSPDQIIVGRYVQITGTSSAGLRIHKDAAQNSDTVFVGNEGEVFIVKDGPKAADGYSWWYIVGKDNISRAGWAAADFLLATEQP